MDQKDEEEPSFQNSGQALQADFEKLFKPEEAPSEEKQPQEQE